MESFSQILGPGGTKISVHPELPCNRFKPNLSTPAHPVDPHTSGEVVELLPFAVTSQGPGR